MPTPHVPLPLAPLLRAYFRLSPPSAPARLLAARYEWLNADFLDQASEEQFVERLIEFYHESVHPPLMTETLRRRARLIRHGFQHLLHGTDPLDRKLDRCLAVDGPYAVAGLGQRFWALVVKALDPERLPLWSSTIERGLQRLGLWPRTGSRFARCVDAYDRLRTYEPRLAAWAWDDFLSRVAVLDGRELSRATPAPMAWALAPDLVRRERTRVPIRRRLRERLPELDAAREQFLAGLAQREFSTVWEALRRVDPVGAARTMPDTAWLPAIIELWEADSGFDALAQVGWWLPVAILHLRDRLAYPLWTEATRAGLAALADGQELATRPEERYRLYREGTAALADRLRLHPLEVEPLLTALAEVAQHTAAAPISGNFRGLCDDSFTFLKELNEHNARAWMEQERERYHFAIREPLRELCRELTMRYVEPVLRRVYGWDIETSPRTGRVLSSICKNDYGRTNPYQPEMWVTFYHRNEHGKRGAAQCFVRLDATGLTYGLHLGRTAREPGRCLRRNVQEHAEPLFRTLQHVGALELTFRADGAIVPMKSVEDLRTWVAGKTLEIARSLEPGSALLDTDDLVGDIVMTFNRVLPVYLFATESEPLSLLAQHHGAGSERFDDADFHRVTHLGEGFLQRARELLHLKRQLILQGVPGTGKTHVARSLARWLTNDRPGAVRLVQFHPAYSYEEFVEGIKARSVEVNGRQEVTYPVEEGLLTTFATEAAAQPDQPFVLVIDEINRGNLARIFGELLYVLEYRDQAVSLPYSRRLFQLPANLYLLGTMNSADRSVAMIDQALRRRFSFLEMPPDAATLATWLIHHPPRAGDGFAVRVVQLFESLNQRLGEDLGPAFQVGHSYFMVPDLDEAMLKTVWDHQIRPLLAEYFALQPARLGRYEFDEWWHSPRRKKNVRIGPGDIG